jgi:heptosyltransferase-1
VPEEPAAALRLLIVKTSSMGDVVHALPVLADVQLQRPGTQVDWLVEPAFAAIPQMHPGVQRVLTLPWRRWRRQLLQRSTWQAMAALRTQLRSAGYDHVLDLQGLLKSAFWARQAGVSVGGYDSRSGREPLASWLYQQRARVSRDLHAVQRCRMLAAELLGYSLPSRAPDFGLQPQPGPWRPRSAYAVLIPNASRPEKHWPERDWIAVGRRMREQGWTPVVLWGNADEQTLAERIAAGCDAEVPPFLKVGEMAGVLAGAQQVVGLDTGFSHLAAALGRPTVGIYCDHEPGLAGITGPGPVASVGGKGQRPTRAEVLALMEAQVQRVAQQAPSTAPGLLWRGGR